MTRTLKLYFLISISMLSISFVNAQGIPDSTLQKVKGERAFYETLGKLYPADSSVAVTETTIAGVKSYWFNESLLNQKEIIIYLHGGGYSLGSIKSYTPMTSHLSKKMHTAILYVEYSLAPEFPFPYANNQILALYKELKKKYPNHKLIIMGDSAGAGLALALVDNIQKSGLSLPNSLALISPWIDLKCINPSFVTRQASDPILTRTFAFERTLLYAGTKIREADPSEIKFKSFPPVFLLVGTNEILYDDSKNFYAVIKPIQQNAKFKEYEGQTHVWPFTNIGSKAAVEAINDIKDFIRAN